MGPPPCTISVTYREKKVDWSRLGQIGRENGRKRAEGRQDTGGLTRSLPARTSLCESRFVSEHALAFARRGARLWWRSMVRLPARLVPTPPLSRVLALCCPPLPPTSHSRIISSSLFVPPDCHRPP